MPSPQLRIGSIFARSLYAPFSLSKASWRALLKPAFALVFSIVLLLMASYLKLNATLQLLAHLPGWVSVVWFAFEYQRHLIAGRSESDSAPMLWRRYGVFCMVLILLCLFLALLLGLLLYLVLPGIAWFLMALNSPQPWLASGSVVLWISVVSIAAYPVARLAMALPAISARHDVDPKHIWHLSQGSGLKLLILLVFVPGLIIGFKNIAFDVYSDQTWAIIVMGILETCFALFYLSILALSYGALSGQQVATETSLKSISGEILQSRFLWPTVFILLAGIGLAAAFDTVYRLDPGQNMIISRWGKPDRVQSGSGIRFKIPFIEQTQPVSETEHHKVEGRGQFFLVTKDSISITYDAFWHVVDADRYFQATAAQPHHASRRLEYRLQNELRNQISMLRPSELHRMMEEGTNKFSIENATGSDLPFDAVLNEVNSQVRVLGIEMTTWHFEIDPS